MTTFDHVHQALHTWDWWLQLPLPTPAVTGGVGIGEGSCLSLLWEKLCRSHGYPWGSPYS